MAFLFLINQTWSVMNIEIEIPPSRRILFIQYCNTEKLTLKYWNCKLNIWNGHKSWRWQKQVGQIIFTLSIFILKLVGGVIRIVLSCNWRSMNNSNQVKKSELQNRKQNEQFSNQKNHRRIGNLAFRFHYANKYQLWSINDQSVCIRNVLSNLISIDWQPCTFPLNT